MWGVIRRLAVPVVLLIGAVAALVYGATMRSVPVTEEQEIEKTIVIPSPFGASGFDDPFNPGMPGGSDNPFASEFTKKVTEKVIVAHDEPETRLIREVTFGGVVRLASGELRRTYTGDPPSLCPS